MQHPDGDLLLIPLGDQEPESLFTHETERPARVQDLQVVQSHVPLPFIRAAVFTFKTTHARDNRLNEPSGMLSVRAVNSSSETRVHVCHERVVHRTAQLDIEKVFIQPLKAGGVRVSQYRSRSQTKMRIRNILHTDERETLTSCPACEGSGKRLVETAQKYMAVSCRWCEGNAVVNIDIFRLHQRWLRIKLIHKLAGHCLLQLVETAGLEPAIPRPPGECHCR